MKLAPPSSKTTVARKAHILPLVLDEEADALTKINSITFDVPSTPGANDSPKYKQSIRVLQGTETARQVITWKTTAAALLAGLSVNTYTGSMTILRQTVKGNARNNLDASGQVHCETLKARAIAAAVRGGNAQAIATARTATLDEYGNGDAANAINAAVTGVIIGALPSKALARAKRQLRRFTRKPQDMEVRTYVQHLKRSNAMEIPHLPPFGNDQHLTEDELIDILMYGTPNRWEAEMDKQGFDPYAAGRTLRQVADFMERLENAEEFGQTSTTVPKTGKSSAKKRSNTGSDSGPSKKKHCIVHGQCAHSTEECTVVKGMVADKSGAKKPFQNKWKRNADAATSASKKDLAVLIKKAVHAATKTKKDLGALSKKRKSDDSSDEELDLNALNLDEFNYNDHDINISDLVEDGEIPLSGKSADC